VAAAASVREAAARAAVARAAVARAAVARAAVARAAVARAAVVAARAETVMAMEGVTEVAKVELATVAVKAGEDSGEARVVGAGVLVMG